MKTYYLVIKKGLSILITSDDLLKELQNGKHPKVINTFYLEDNGSNIMDQMINQI